MISIIPDRKPSKAARRTPDGFTRYEEPARWVAIRHRPYLNKYVSAVPCPTHGLNPVRSTATTACTACTRQKNKAWRNRKIVASWGIV